MITVNDINFSGKRAVVRVDFNVPINARFEVTDNTRIAAAIPTIKKIISDGGSVVLMSHLGRPKKEAPGAFPVKFSLKNIVSELSGLLGIEVKFTEDCISDKAFSMSSSLEAGEVLLLENLRYYKEEEAGDKVFAQKLSAHGDVYVNDAFGTAHRAHASTAIITDFFTGAKASGLLMSSEVSSLELVLSNYKKPFTAIVGGAKVSSKISIISHLLDKIDNLIIGGGMAYTFFKAQGGQVGNSLVEDDYLDEARKILKKAVKKGVRVILPTDSICADSFSNEAAQKIFNTKDILSGWMGMDIGPKAIKSCKVCIEESQTILWNGPIGVFEFKQFSKGTKLLAHAITNSSAYSLAGGGDTIAAIEAFGIEKDISYVSTAGGAFLEFVEGKKLPAIEILEKRAKK